MGREGISDSDVVRALADAGMAAELASGHIKLDMFVGERGANLSGGQRQRGSACEGARFRAKSTYS